jgi:hypothetical protein
LGLARKLRFISLSILLAFALSSPSHSQWKTDGRIEKDSLNSVSDGDFGASLMLTDDANGLFEAWDHPPSRDYGPNISVVDSAERGDIILAFVIFTGCEDDSTGNCNLTVRYTAYFPNGSVYGELSGSLWVGRPSPGSGPLQLSEDNLGLRIEADDPFGEYRIVAEIADKVSGSNFSLETMLNVVESR